MSISRDLKSPPECHANLSAESTISQFGVGGKAVVEDLQQQQLKGDERHELTSFVGVSTQSSHPNPVKSYANPVF